MRILRKIIGLLTVCIPVLVLGQEKDFSCTGSDRGCILSFSPDEFNMDTLFAGGREYHRFSFLNSAVWGNPGDPSVPYRILVVGVPPEGDVAVSFSGTEYEEAEGVRLYPVPAVERDHGMPREILREGEKYQSAGPWPAGVLEAEPPEWFGPYRVVRIKLFPVQFFPEKQTVRRWERITVTVSFRAPGMKEGLRKNAGDPLYRRAMVNFDQAREWYAEKRSGLFHKRTMKTGEWYKIPVTGEGMYRITGSLLENRGVNIGAILPSTLKIYNNGGRELPRDLSEAQPDSLIENPVALVGMDDGRFDASDYILFYGKGVTGWEYDSGRGKWSHTMHHYTDENCYWLVFNDGIGGKRIPVYSSPSSGDPVSTCREPLFFEQDINNPLNGGIYWYGALLDNTASTQTFTVNLANPVSNDTLAFCIQIKGGSTGSHNLSVAWNGRIVHTFGFSGSILRSQDFISTQSALNGQNTVTVVYSGSGIAANAYLDWLELSYRRPLSASSGRLHFFSPAIPGTYEYRVSGFSTTPRVFDVTDPYAPAEYVPSLNEEEWRFSGTVTAGRPARYSVYQESAFLSPASVTRDDAEDLRDASYAADFFIIAPAALMDQANRLKEHRMENDSLSTQVIDIQNVYDDFSWGLNDPTAIRNFLKYAFDHFTPAPSYVLLLGDGDYDYKGVLSSSGVQYIPPFEFEGYTDSGTRASDDWYTYVSGSDSKMDMTIGRIPVQNASQAQTVIDKIIAYETSPVPGDWKILATLVGDDEKAGQGDENEVTHTRATELIAETVLPEYLNFRKIYLTEYPEVMTAEGRRKPQARDDLVSQINEGTLLVNFIGHGNEELWAHERVFQRDVDLAKLQNGQKCPLIYAATCAFGWYDNPREQSCGEELLTVQGKGAIAVIAASRFCSAAPNEALNQAFYAQLFMNSAPTLRIGDALRIAKLYVASTVNNEMYHVLGDPTLRLAVPRFEAAVTSMQPDSFKALAVIHIEGEIRKGGSLWSAFDRDTVEIKGFDSKKAVTYMTQYGTRLYYLLPGNALYRGKTTAESGRFEIRFVVPKDISYGGNTGRLTCYFWKNREDGTGFMSGIAVGGTASLNDGTGPDIRLYFEGFDSFVSGGMVTEDPILIAAVGDDSSGINITGEIGHKMILTMDESDPLDVTRAFQYDDGSYLAGKLKYPLSLSGDGEHQLTLKAWDNANNSSMETIFFRIVSSDEIRIESLLTYPNPTSGSTHFTFYLNQEAEIEIKVFTVDGRLIRRLTNIPGNAGFNMIPWDGTDDRGDVPANGVYIYKVIARAVTEDGKMEEALERMIIMR